MKNFGILYHKVVFFLIFLLIFRLFSSRNIFIGGWGATLADDAEWGRVRANVKDE